MRGVAWIEVQCPVCSKTDWVLPPDGQAGCTNEGRHEPVLMQPVEERASA